ncbi:MAG: rhodanese-like domain-containing protein [Verrucomicrobiota bacterium]
MLTSPMRDLLAEYPSARRALFAHFHIGGCQSCAYSETDTLQQVCQQHDLNPDDVQQAILQSHEEEQLLLISPPDLAQKLTSPSPPTLVDTRTREEHEAVAIPNSQLLTENTLAQLNSENPNQQIILYDHSGKSVLDQVSWFRGHQLKNTFALAGGIDAYSQQVDPSLPRYRLEID